MDLKDFVETKTQEESSFQRTLGFEIVDYAIDYIGFKKNVNYFKAGDIENFKLEIIIRQIINYESPQLTE